MAIETRNPATGEVLKSFEPLSDAEVDERIARAADAAASYRRTTFAEVRAAVKPARLAPMVLAEGP